MKNSVKRLVNICVDGGSRVQLAKWTQRSAELHRELLGREWEKPD